MFPCLSIEIPREKVMRMISNIRKCPICSHGFWKNDECFHCEKIRTIEIIKNRNKKEVKKIKEARKPIYKLRKKKLKTRIRLVGVFKKCKVCGEDSGKKMCCSELCYIKQSSYWYDKGGLRYINNKEAQKRLSAKVERKRLKKLNNKQ